MSTTSCKLKQNRFFLSETTYIHNTYSSVFTAPPVLTGDTSILKVAAQLGNESSFSVMIYSTSPIRVEMHRPHSDVTHVSESRAMTYSTNFTTTHVDLKVFDKTLETDGLQALIQFTVNKMEGLGEYELLVNNSIGSATRTVHIVAEGVYFELKCVVRYLNRLVLKTYYTSYLNMYM